MKKMQGTSILHVNELRSWENSTEIVKDGQKVWVHARPIGNLDVWSRFKIALKVFRGQADAVTWEQQ